MLRLFINLDRSQNRLQSMNQAIQALNLSFTRISGIDAKEFTSEDLHKYELPLEKKTFYLTTMTEGEIACYLSHIKALKYFLEESDEDWALICEDDIVFKPEAVSVITGAQWIPDGIEIINIATPYVQNEPVMRIRELPCPHGRLLETLLPISGSQAYIISRRAARAFVDYSEKGFPVAVDVVLFGYYSQYRKQFISWTLAPGVSYSNDQGESLIGEHRHNRQSPWWKVPGKYLYRRLLKLRLAFLCTFMFTKERI